MATFKFDNLLRDALNYTSPDSGASAEKAQGVVIGVVSTLMAQGKSYNQALQIVRNHLPNDFHFDTIPNMWLADMSAK